MIQINTHTTRRTLKMMTIVLGTMSMSLIVYGLGKGGAQHMNARLLPKQMTHQTPWITISAQQILSGATVPQDTNVIIHIPEEITRITRRTLFGQRGDRVRYWGYCFPHNAQEAARKSQNGFPGDLFLSEAEREYRRNKLVEERRRTFSVFKNLTEQDLNETQTRTKSRIRHQLEVFAGGTSCYIMTSAPLPIGSDEDGDDLNSFLERSYGSDPRNADTDGDGILDGLEVFRLGTHPTKRDSDGDGIIDGIEDANRNGRFDPGETNATQWDTDRDGLCDGICKVNKGQDFRGEDKNLNGIYEPDLNEYNPRTVDSDGDGVRDEHEVYLCVLGGGDDC